MTKSKEPKRWLHLRGLNKTLDIERVVEINTEKQMIVFEQMPSEGWRLTYSKATIEDAKLLEALEIVREENDN